MHFKYLVALCITAFFVIGEALTVFGQQVKIEAFSIERSDLIEQLKQKKKDSPKVVASDLADYANDLLAKTGLNFEFGLSPEICKAIADKKARTKAQQNPAFGITARFNQERGEPVAIKFSDIATDIDACGTCAVEMPVITISDKDFVTIIQGLNIKLQLSPDISLEKVELIDNQNLKNVVRSWQMPFQTTPIGVSEDKTILYLELPIAELSDLALQIYGTGAIQFAAKKDLNLKDEAKMLKDAPKDSNNSYLSYITFGAGAAKKTLRFSAPCS